MGSSLGSGDRMNVGPAKNDASEVASILAKGFGFCSDRSVRGVVFFSDQSTDATGPAMSDASECVSISVGGLSFFSHRSMDGARLAGLFHFSLGVPTRPRRSTPPSKVSARRRVLSVIQLELPEARPGRSTLSLIQLRLIEARPGCCFLLSNSTRAVYTAGGGARRRQCAGVGSNGGRVAATWLVISAKQRTQQRTEKTK